MAALLAVWIALGAVVTVIVAAATRWGGREAVMTLLPYTIAFAATLAASSLWRLRGRKAGEAGVGGQRSQAWIALALCTTALAALLIWANGWLFGLAGLAIELGFLTVCYWGYTRVVLHEG